MKVKIKTVLADFRHIFLNYFVNKIPCWTIRKLIYKLFGLKIGKHSRIGIDTMLVSINHIIIGDNTVINEKCFLDGRGTLQIGNNCSISPFVKIITATHNPNTNNFTYLKYKTIIENNVWIGTGAIILDNTTLKEGSIVGAGAVFKGVSYKNTIYVGNPAKKIKDREQLEFEKIQYKAYFK